MTDPTAADPRRARRLLLIITACFALPLMVAVVLVQIWRPSGGGAHGELLHPARPLPALVLQQAGESITVETLIDHHWTLLYWLSNDCNSLCERSLYHMRQVRLALGKDANRVQTVLALDSPPPQGLSDWLAGEHAAMARIQADGALPTFLADVFAAGDPEGWIYLVDPLGNLLMRYAGDGDPSGMLDDLKRLLKLSRIG